MNIYLVYYNEKLGVWDQYVKASKKVYAYTEAQAIYKFEKIFNYGTAIAVEKI